MQKDLLRYATFSLRMPIKGEKEFSMLREVKILIIDDEPDIRDLICDALVISGKVKRHQVFGVGSGEEAIKVFHTISPQIVLSDIMMPKVRGPEFMKWLRQEKSEVEIGVITAYGDTDTLLDLYQYGVTGVVRKPFSLQEIESLVTRMMDRIHLKWENEIYRKRLIERERLSSLGLVAAGVAHEINNPTTFIKGNLQLMNRLLSSNPNPDELKKVVASAINGCERVERIVSTLLRFSGKRAVERDIVEVSRLLEDVRLFCSHRLDKIELVVESPKDISPIYVDLHELTQAIINLILNALDAMETRRNKEPEFRPKLEILISEEKELGRLLMKIKDNGTGIPPHVQEKLFTPFFTTKERDSGTGLGLSLARNAIEELGGEIKFFSEVGKGTTFEVRLPTEFCAVDSTIPQAA